MLGGGNSNIFHVHPYLMIQFDEHIFRLGWFNHQLDEGLGSLGGIGSSDRDLPYMVMPYKLPGKFSTLEDFFPVGEVSS